ncbi:MAG: exodeoxyribonuclease VII large subunit [Chloroflexi bacterium]|nr:exodeoxyribonuclease VII large subunit [Chloroflexota bacterium]
MQILRVSQVSQHLKEMLESDPLLQDLWVEGELCNVSRSPAGHFYFSLKEENSQLRCVLFRREAGRQSLLPQDGLAVIIHGRMVLYEPNGTWQVSVDTLWPEGVGRQQLQFEHLRRKLDEEGLFEPSRKRPLPLRPRRIGLVTSPRGAALHDVVTVLKRRYPLGELLLSPAIMQGDSAPTSVVAAIGALERCPDVDVIVVARGGGAPEELQTFNDERVARAIFASKVPIVTGIGHETDTTIADLVADRRAPTPSVAAELVSPDWEQMMSQVDHLSSSLVAALRVQVQGPRKEVWQRLQRLERLSPLAVLANRQRRVEELQRDMRLLVDHLVSVRIERVLSRYRQLVGMSPFAVLERGYAICQNLQTGLLVQGIEDVNTGDSVEVTVKDGRFEGQVWRKTLDLHEGRDLINTRRG